MKKVIITGAGGFIGKALVKKLLSKDIVVYGIDVDYENLKDISNKNFYFVKACFDDYGHLEELIAERDFDAFYHFAWNGVFGNAFKNYELQLQNAKFCCDAIIKAKKLNCKKFILAGTMNQYETLAFMNKSNIQPRYTSIYATAKIAADMICKTIAYNENIEYNAGLIAMAYGENNRSLMLPNVIIRDLLNKIPPRLITGDNLYDLMYIDDIAHAFLCIGEEGINQKSYYIGHRKNELKTFKEWIENIRDIVSPSTPLLFGEYPENNEFEYSVIDTESLYIDTHFSIENDFEVNIKKTANWIKYNLMEENK